MIFFRFQCNCSLALNIEQLFLGLCLCLSAQSDSIQGISRHKGRNSRDLIIKLKITNLVNNSVLM